MQGLPIQLLSKSAKNISSGEKSASVKTETGDSVAIDGKDKSSKGNIDFSALFEGLKASENKTEVNSGITTEVSGEVKTEKGEALKNLVAPKGKGQKSEEQKSEDILITVADPKQAEALIAALAAKGETVAPANSKLNASLKNAEVNVEQKIAKTSSSLDQLLNSLKGTQDKGEVTEEEGSDSLQGAHNKKLERPIKGELKTENPLEFLMNGAKTKGVSTSVETKEPSDIETLLGQKKMMTGEDYLKNMESSEKKVSVKTPQVNVPELAKNLNQNVKVYGQGLTLLSDPLIRNTKDLAFKDGNKGKHASSDELRAPDMKVGAELSTIKQDAIPMMQHKANNNDQQAETQTQANQKVLDLGKLNTANTTEIIKRISDYVEQNQVANKSSLDLTVKHDSLGEFKIQVSRSPNQSMNSAANLIDMQITTSSKEGQDFFVKNEVSLMKNLNNAGINLSDFRIVSSMSDSSFSGQTDSRQSNSQQNADGSSKQFMSFDSRSFAGDSSNGKDKRKELWEEYQQRYGA